jgi:NDP-sugar pyrophosphorylase family protein
MTGLAMIMAGGGGTRMLASGNVLPKPLVRVGGVSLLEHNLNQLCRHGFDRVVVVTPASVGSIAAFVQDDLRTAADRVGVDVELIVEQSPLGNIGAVGLLADRNEPALVVFADNLTCLDLRSLFEGHCRGSAAVTVATHAHAFKMPFGEVLIRDGQLAGYHEKPTYQFNVCSAVSAVSPRAMAMVAPGQPLGLSDLINRLIAAGEPVAAYPHEAPWIDVNDTLAVEQAEMLLNAYPARFAATLATSGA